MGKVLYVKYNHNTFFEACFVLLGQSKSFFVVHCRNFEIKKHDLIQNMTNSIACLRYNNVCKDERQVRLNESLP